MECSSIGRATDFDSGDLQVQILPLQYKENRMQKLNIQELEQYLENLKYIRDFGNVTIGKEYLQSIVQTAIEFYYKNPDK
jgi:hypothetical protein